MTVAQAFERFLQQKSRSKFGRQVRRVAEHLVREFGADTRLKAVTAARISAYKAAAPAAIGTAASTGRSPC